MAKLEEIISRGATGTRPAAGIAGQLFYDTTLEKWQRDNGAAWQDCEPAAGGGDVLWAAIQASELANEIMNYPSLEIADNVQPEWWEVGANCTLTEVDLAGEGGITESWERALKAVTTATPRYFYQRYTYADQPRLKLGKTISAIFAVWSVGAAAARIRLQSSVGSLGVSANTVAAAWTILTVNSVVLDGTYVDIRCEVDNGTAYFVPLGLHVGSEGWPLAPRGLVYRERHVDSVVNDADPGPTWTDAAFAASTSPITAIVEIGCYYLNTTNTATDLCLRRNGSAEAASGGNMLVRGFSTTIHATGSGQIQTDDGQVFEYCTGAAVGDAEHVFLHLHGWWEWA